MSSLAQIFETGEQTSQKGHFRNLVMIARYDGKISTAENNLLNRISNRLSLTDEQVKEIKENPETYPVIPPYSHEERIERYVQLLEMALIDEVLSHDEEEFIKHMGIALGFTSDEVNKITKIIIEDINSGISREETLKKIM